MNMMNCLEFCRQAQADPHHFSSQARAHVEHCESCQIFVARMRQVDETVAETLRKVPVPDGMSERILLSTTKKQAVPWKQLALAASVIMGLTFSLTLPLFRADVGLARAALAHVEEEPDALMARQKIAQPNVVSALASVGAKLRGDIGKVTYLGSCPLPGGEGKHMVVSSPHGRYTLILMPAQIKSRNKAEDGMHAAIAKPASRGTYAIVASATPDLLKIEKMVDQNIIW